jgi:hypothetical protein
MRSCKSRGARRGAVFVESIVVISFFTMCFVGVVYFRELYLGKMRVQRLARASAMAHAMGACKGDPKAGLEEDLPVNPPKPPEENPTPGAPLDLETPPGRARDALNKFGQSKAGTPLDTITTITITTSAAAGTKANPAAKRNGFESSVDSRSFVTCADPVRDGQFEEILPHIEDIFSSFF